MKGARSTLVMLVVLIALGGYVYFVELERPPASEAPPNEPLFEELATEDIVRLSIRGSDGNTSLRRDGATSDSGDWQITAPIETAADDVEVSSILSNLSSLEIQRVVEEDDVTDLEPFGLADPVVEVTFMLTGDDAERHLLIGDSTPTGADRYAKLAGSDRIVLVTNSVESTFNKSTLDLRDKTILDVDTTQVDSLRLALDQTTIRLAKSDNAWRLVEPWDARADYSLVEGLVGRLGSGEFRAVATEDLNADEPETNGASDPYGLGEPAVTVTLTAGSATASLVVGGQAETGTRYARDLSRDLVFTIDGTLATDLEREADAYREKDLFTFRSFNARRLEIERTGDTTIFEKIELPPADDAAEDDQLPEEIWRRTRPGELDIDRPAMDDLLSKLSNLSGESFIESRSEAGLGDDNRVATVRVTYGDDETEEQVVFWRSGDATYAVHGDEPGAAVVNTQNFDDALEALEQAQAGPSSDEP